MSAVNESVVNESVANPPAKNPSEPAPRPLSLSANFSWMLVGMATYAACQWSCLIVLAKFGSPQAVGQFALGLAVTAPLFMLANLKLRNVQATDSQRQFQYVDYFRLRLATTLIAVLALTGIVWSAGYASGITWLILAIGAGRAFDAVNDIRYGLLQQSERMERVAWAMMINGILSLSLLWAGLLLTGQVLYGAIGWAAGTGLTSGFTWLLIARQRPATASRQPAHGFATLARLCVLALPLGMVMMLVSLTTNIPRYFVEAELGVAALGMFAATAYLIDAGKMVVLALGHSASPRLAKSFANGDLKAFRILLLKLVGIGALGGFIGVILSWTIGAQILRLLYRPEYADHVPLLIAMSFVAMIVFSCSFLGDAMIAARCFRIQVPLLVVVVGVTSLGCWMLVPRYQLLGAVYSLGAGYACHFIGSIAIISWALRGRHRARS